MVVNGGPSNDYYMVSRNRFFSKAEARILLDDLGTLPMVQTRGGADAVKMWFGPEGTVTPLHHDDRNNVIVQIIGVKTVTLSPPYYAVHMRQEQAWYAAVDPTKPDDPSRTKPLRSDSFDLLPGDALFIPVGWWHSVISHSPSITMAFVDFDGERNDFGVP